MRKSKGYAQNRDDNPNITADTLPHKLVISYSSLKKSINLIVPSVSIQTLTVFFSTLSSHKA